MGKATKIKYHELVSEMAISLSSFDLTTDKGCTEARQYLHQQLALTQADLEYRKREFKRIKHFVDYTKKYIEREYMQPTEGKEASHE